MARVRAEEYAPYHKMNAFWAGVMDYQCGRTDKDPKYSSAERQAYDRGMEYAMRCRQEDR